MLSSNLPIDQETEIRSKSLLLLWTLNANLGAFTSGIFFTAFNVCIYQVLLALKSSQSFQNLTIAFISAAIPLGGIAGGIISSSLAVKFERRRLMIITDLITVASCILSQSTYIGIMVIGRVLCGLVCGVNFMLVPLYVRELLPSHLAPATPIMFRGMFSLGACLSFFVGCFGQKPPSEPNNVWVGVFVMPIIFAAIRILLLVFVARLDTPAFYIKTGDPDKAWKILDKIYKDGCLDTAYRRERQTSIHFRFRDIFSFEYRGQVRFALLTVLFAQLMGGNLTNFYSTMLFFAGNKNITDQNYADVGILNVLLGFVNLFATIFGYLMLRKLGKRPLLIYGAVIIFALSVAIAFSELISFIVGQGTLIVLFGAAHNLTFGLVASTYAYELLPSYSLVLQVVGEMLGMLGPVFLFPLIQVEFNFLIIAVMSVVGVVISFKMVKETNGMTTDEIHRLFNAQSKGLLDDEVTMPSNSLIGVDELYDSVEPRSGSRQSIEGYEPVY